MTPNKGGRKPLPPASRRVPVSLYMTPAELAALEAIGDGNRQEGFRILLDAWGKRRNSPVRAPKS